MKRILVKLFFFLLLFIESNTVKSDWVAARFGTNIATEGFVHTALEPGDPEETLKQAVQTSAIREASNFVASKIGVLSHEAKINRWTQRLMHGVVGAGTAGLCGANPAAGAIGAVIGEMVGESYRASHPEMETLNPQSEEFDRLRHRGEYLAQFVAATCTLMAGKDPTIAIQTAGNAARENALWFFPLVIAGVTVAGGVYEAKRLYDVYHTQGPEAAVVELVILCILTYTGGKVVQYTLKGCAKVYPTAELAWQAAVDSSPLMNKVGEGFSKAGRGVSKAIDKTDAYVADKAGSLFRAITGRGAAGEVSAGRPVVGQALSKETQAATKAKTGPPNVTAQASVAHDAASNVRGQRPDGTWRTHSGNDWWKSKIVGRAQATGADTLHQQKAYAIAVEAAKHPEVTNVYINRGIHRALKDAGKEDLLRLPSNSRPDVMFVTKDGKYHFREVASKTDVPKKLDARMAKLHDELPKSMEGTAETFEFQVLHIKYDKRSKNSLQKA